MITDTDTFTWRGQKLFYLDDPYNTTILNERAVEVPIAFEFIEKHSDQIGLEVGNVMNHYTMIYHAVVDLYEKEPHVLNMDVFDIEGRFDWILAVSTLEHVYSTHVPNPTAPMDAIAHLYRMLNPGGEMMVTVPFGQHPYLDVAILNGLIGPDTQGCLVWDYEEEVWQSKEDELIWRPAREKGWAQVVWIGTWQKP